RAKIEILLLAQIGRHAGNDLGYTSLREFNGIHRRSAYTQLSRTVLLEVAMVDGIRDRACRMQRDAKLTSESCRSSRSNRDFILRSRTKDRTPIFPWASACPESCFLRGTCAVAVPPPAAGSIVRNKA